MATPLACHEEILAGKLGDYGPDHLAAGPLCVVRGSLASLEATVLSGHAGDPDRVVSRDVKVPEDRCCLDVKPIGVPGGVLARDARLDVICERGALYYAAVLEVSREAGDEDIGRNPCDGRHLKELINALAFQFNIDSPGIQNLKK